MPSLRNAYIFLFINGHGHHIIGSFIFNAVVIWNFNGLLATDANKIYKRQKTYCIKSSICLKFFVNTNSCVLCDVVHSFYSYHANIYTETR